jgi:hypothetical protein
MEGRMATTVARLVGSRDGELAFQGGVDARFMIRGQEAGERFSLVEGVRAGQRSQLAELCRRYDVDMDIDRVPGLINRFGLRFPAAPH